jgi:hypothetical protein
MKLVFSCSCQCLNEIPNFEKYGNSSSSMGIGHSFKVMSTSDILICMELCCKYSLCRSVDLNREQKKCRLNVRSSAEEPGLLVSSVNTHHIDKMHFPQVSRIRFEVNISVYPDTSVVSVGHTKSYPRFKREQAGRFF